MKKMTFLVSIIFACYIQPEAKTAPGFFITNSGDTVHATFQISYNVFNNEIKCEKLQDEACYYDSQNVKHCLTADSATELQIEFQGKTFRMLSRPGIEGISDRSIFLRLIKDGRVKLFEYYETATTQGFVFSGNGMAGGGSSPSKKYALQKDNERLESVNVFTFRVKMEKYIADCPELLKKVENFVYIVRDLPLVIEKYNKGCM